MFIFTKKVYSLCSCITNNKNSSTYYIHSFLDGQVVTTMKKCVGFLNKVLNVNLVFKEIKDPQSHDKNTPK